MKYTIVTESEGIKVLFIKIILVIIDIFVSLMLFSSGAAYERYSNEKDSIKYRLFCFFMMISIGLAVALAVI